MPNKKSINHILKMRDQNSFPSFEKHNFCVYVCDRFQAFITHNSTVFIISTLTSFIH